MSIDTLNTPAALIDVARMRHNIDGMQSRLDKLGVRFRPHVKTTKCKQVVDAQVAAGACGITVSTLKEAEQFFRTAFATSSTRSAWCRRNSRTLVSNRLVSANNEYLVSFGSLHPGLRNVH
ncbi:hypothetical protein OKW49_007037 [Paraburkholderia youngii]